MLWPVHYGHYKATVTSVFVPELIANVYEGVSFQTTKFGGGAN